MAAAPGGCGGGQENSSSAPADALGGRLAKAFRIDVSEIDITQDYWPSDSRVEGSAELRFEMRPGQSRPLFHFNPIRGSAKPAHRMLHSLELDGEELDPRDAGDVRRVRALPSAEPAFELQRDLAEGEAHTLRVSWSMSSRVSRAFSRAHPDWFLTNFDDTEGPRDETETLWPTISSPEEFARHRVRVRVHADRKYTVLGSGVVRQEDAARVQTWKVDSQRPIASHTMFFAAVPAGQVRTSRFDSSGVDVTIVSDRPLATIDKAKAITRRTITSLISELGPFPMARMQILLTGWGSGMEYFGATRTGIGSLEHELAHMYFGASTVNRTWRDTWIDESAVVWWERQDSSARLDPGFASDIASGRTALEPGFDGAAYGAGARILGEVALGLGGKQRMLGFLADLHSRRAYRPFTTQELIDDALAAQDSVDRADFDRWLYAEKAPK